MYFLDEIKIRTNIKKAKNIEYDELIENAEYILSICNNELRIRKDGKAFWFHSLPLNKNTCNEIQGMKEENWNVSDKKKITKILSQLDDYCSIILKLFYKDNTLILMKDIIILPPWLVFPLYNGNSPGWRQGSGEAYMEAYIYYIRHLSDYDFEKYDKRFPTPDYMNTNMFVLNFMNYNLKHKKERM